MKWNQCLRARLVLLGFFCTVAFDQASAGTVIPPDVFGGYTAKPLTGSVYSCGNVGSLCGGLFDGISSGSFTGSSVLPNGSSLALTATGSGSFGSLHIGGTDMLTDPSRTASVYGQDFSLFREILTVTYGGTTGMGYIQFIMTADGSSFATGSGQASADIGFDVFNGGAPFQSAGFGLAPNGTSVVVTPLFGFQYGQPFNFAAQMDLIFRLGPGDGVASANFMNTATLTGIRVFDSDQTPVMGWDVVSGSGTTYGPSGIVPEPSSATLILLGLLAITAAGLGCGRRRQTHLSN